MGIEITQPDDWHLHLRDGAMLKRVLPSTARVFGRAIVMPNLTPAITTVAAAGAYRERIRAALPPGCDFEPLMTLYLTEGTRPEEVEAAAQSPFIHGFKLYPKGATTNSEAGVEGLESLRSVIEALERFDLPLLVHGESTRPDCDVFDRERAFLDETLAPLVSDHPRLRVVFEHITTAEAVAFVSGSSDRVAATITPQHLLLNRNALFEGGLRPHHYCLPLLKRERDRAALVAAATSGDPGFFLGTDSAPHERVRKESDGGCAGVYSAPIALELYAEVFDRADAIDRLEGFASHHGPDFYGLPRNPRRLRLERRSWVAPVSEGEGEAALQVLWGGRPLRYRIPSEAIVPE